MTKRDDFWTDDKLLPASRRRDLSSTEITSNTTFPALPITPSRTMYENGLFHPLEMGEGESTMLNQNSRILISATVSFPGYEKMAFREYRKKALTSHNTSPKAAAPYRSFYTVMPRYESLGKEQFHYYLTWRDKVRQGKYIQVDYGYLYLYIYELLNLIGDLPPQDVLSALLSLWKAYRKDFPMLDRQLGDWLLDLCILWKLPLPAEDILDIYCTGEQKTLPLSVVCGVVDGLLCGKIPLTPPRKELLLKHFCSYHFRQSRYYRENGRFAERMEDLITELLPKIIASGILLPSHSSSAMKLTRIAFWGTVISAEKRRAIKLEYYTNWGEETLSSALGDCLKVLDNALRTSFGIRSRLSGMHLPEDITKMITNTVADEAPVKIPVKVPIKQKKAAVDLKIARNMEESAWETTKLLTAYLTEDTPEEEIIPTIQAEKKATPPSADNRFAVLDKTEAKALLLLAKKDIAALRQLALQNALFPEALADAINEKLLDFYGEPICDAQGVYDEYADEILSSAPDYER